MKRETFIELVEVKSLDDEGAEPKMGLRAYDTYGNGTSAVHLLDEFTREEVLAMSDANLVWCVHESWPNLIRDAVVLKVRGRPFDLTTPDWREPPAAAYGAAPHR